jgi:hypothetical protein
MERMLQAAYAVFWDKPGYGESTGRLVGRRVYHHRAQIVLDALAEFGVSGATPCCAVLYTRPRRGSV